MPVITEEFLRKIEKQGKLNTLKISEKDILTPSAREFLSARKIKFEEEKAVQEDLKPEIIVDKAPVYKYKCYVTEAT